MVGYQGKNFDPNKARPRASKPKSVRASVKASTKSARASVKASAKSPRKSVKVSARPGPMRPVRPVRPVKAIRASLKLKSPRKSPRRSLRRSPTNAAGFKPVSTVARKFGRNQEPEYFTGGIFEPLNYLKKVYLSLDNSTNGLTGFLVKMYGLKKAIDLWEWMNNRHVYSMDPKVVVTADAIEDAMKDVDKIIKMEKEDLEKAGEVYVADLNKEDATTKIVNEDKNLVTAQFRYYKNNLEIVNILTYRLNQMDEIYKKANGQFYFRPNLYRYFSRHVIDPDTDRVSYVPHQPSRPEETKITVTTGGGAAPTTKVTSG